MALDFGINTGFVEELYAQYLENPESVEASWRSYFDDRLGSTNGTGELLRRAPGLPLTNGHLARSLDKAFHPHAAAAALPVPSPLSHEREVLAEAAIQARVYKLLNAYRVRGHLFAHIDPLGVPPAAPPELDLSNFELSPEDLDKPFPTIDLAGAGPVQTLREIIQRLEETYCRSIGIEYTHIEVPEQRAWLQQRMESTKNRLTLGD